MKLLNYKITYVLPLLSAIGLVAILTVTNPLQAGAAGILFAFVLMYIFWASVFFIFLHAGIGVVARMVSRKENVNIRQWRIGVRKSYYIASVLAFAPVLLLAMHSVGQLQVQDIALIVVLLFLGIFYIVKRT